MSINGDENPSHYDREKWKRIVDEILEETGNKLKGPRPESEEEKCVKRLEECNNEVVRQVRQYYDDHPISVDRHEVEKIIMRCYKDELSKWKKDDLLFIMCYLQTFFAMKKFGF